MASILHSITRSLLPTWVYQRLIGDWNAHGFKKHFFNTSWMATGRLVALIVSFFTTALVARYLGPENLGKLSYAQSFVAIASVFASLGIDQIIYRNLIAEPHEEAKWLGTAIVTKLFLGTITFLVTVGVSLTTNDEPLLTWLIALIAFTFILQPFGTVSHLFNALIKAKYTTYATLIVSLLIPALKVLVIYTDKGILFFAAIITLEALVYAVVYLLIYRYVLKYKPQNWRYSTTAAKQLLIDSWPLALASLSGYVYGRIDQVMIHYFLNSSAVGVYDVAVRLTELMAFLPGIIVGSLLPAIIGLRESNQNEYRRRWQALTYLCLLIAVGSSIVLFVIAPYVVALLFGDAFAESISLVRLYVWSTVGTIAVILMYQYFVAEHRSHLFLVFSIAGALINIGLNYLLIPLYGIHGAALATIFTLSSIILLFLISYRFIFTTEPQSRYTK